MPRSQETYKSEIVKDYLIKYPKISSMSLARMLNRDYPIDFKVIETARSTVRRLRNELKTRPNQDPIAHRTNEEKKQAMRRFELPESDYEEQQDFIVPGRRGFIMSDIHLPYQDNQALDTAINKGIDFNPDFVYLNGDILDMYQSSLFIKDRRKRDLAGELEIGRQFLSTLKETFNCPIYYKMGNHEDRWMIFLMRSAPELLGIPEFDLSVLLRFGEYGVQKVESRQKAMIGKLPIIHGHEFGHSVFSPVNPARGLYMRAKDSSVVGHHHRVSEHTEKDIHGDISTTWSMGCLCGLQAEYLPFNNWSHGFATVVVDESGNYEFRNYRIIDGIVR